ncbi:hypothetical protein QBC40DRAFT_254846 [Triangularia verruculosa]|uniref:Uncharacterized protein n=1 Tax=Triangularia verruculosa TaxID=2587418 RepID=A0AAN6XJJ8_9PEZI|nr:hypothetical protein QBC40DRAFT_254846 [Triangularia verruculosa]
MKYLDRICAILSLLSLSGLGLSLGPYNGGFTYWIDQSCYDKAPDFDLFMNEVFYEARSASNRLRDPSDIDFATVFWATFKVPVQDTTRWDLGYEARRLWGRGEDYSRTAYETVVQGMECLAHDWTRTRDIRRANVQLWCDNGDRYRKHGARSWDPVNQVWIDTRHVTAPASHACQDYNDGNQVNAETNPHFTRRPDRPAWFYDITLCDGMWEELRNIDDILHASGNNDLTRFGMGIGKIEWFFPHLTIMHEFFHVLPWAFMDPQGPGLGAGRLNGWAHAMATTTEQALSDPEPYTMLALWAALADLPPAAEEGARSRGGYTIARDWSLFPDTLKWRDGNPGVDGRMVAYRDITGVRALR